MTQSPTVFEKFMRKVSRLNCLNPDSLQSFEPSMSRLDKTVVRVRSRELRESEQAAEELEEKRREEEKDEEMKLRGKGRLNKNFMMI